MASFSGLTTFVLYLAVTLLFSGKAVLGGVQQNVVTCTSLDSSMCAFAVSSSGMRCVLETRVRRGGHTELSCWNSQIMAENLSDWVETDECIAACGLNRNTIGISSDFLSDGYFPGKLCSRRCYKGCPNIVDLYFNLAAGEGVFLPKLCELQATSARNSNGVAAAGPVSGSGDKLACAPSQADEIAAAGPALAPVGDVIV